ncbi:thiamine biosynthesis protein ThiF [Sulfurimonas sp.]|uniref:thiamine biosynthesis protein ThiF n=1 Tax=Sulfurimonas sp. TaxID=2022749 RepID=UPI0035692ED6
MIAGFEDKLHCEGIVGDGCGGGRIFFIDEDALKVYDPTTKEQILLLDGVTDAKAISKKACTVTIECENEVIKFDLSLMQKI